MRTVFLDDCVLVPITLTNVILTAADHGLLKPCWSPEVIEEAVEAICRVRPGLDEKRIRHRFAAMDRAFEGSSVSGDPSVLDGWVSPDPDDLHVIASAIAAEADVIVTANVRDFPKAVMAGLGLLVMSPDELLLGLLEDNQEEVIHCVVEMAAASYHPQRTPREILMALELSGVPNFAAEARRLLG